MSTKANWPEKMTALRLRQHKDIYEYRIMGAVTTDASVYSTDKDVLEYRAKQVRALPKMVELLKVAVKFYEFSLNADICDCDANGHWCGKPERDKELCEMKDILREIGEIDA